MTLNEQKLNDLEKMVESELAKVDYSKKGCFGTLLVSRGDDYCKACDDFAVCEATMKENEAKLIADINVDAEKAEAKEVDTQLKEVLENPEPEKPAEKPKSIEAEGLKIKTKIPVDWDSIVNEIVSIKPESFKETAKIVRAGVAKEYTASAYGWTNKLIAGLAKQGAIEYDTDSRAISWA
jgi:hypothetical protein